jgi:hypothetical protein
MTESDTPKPQWEQEIKAANDAARQPAPVAPMARLQFDEASKMADSNRKEKLSVDRA